MHDFFEILGVPASARAVEVRRLCAGYVRRWHPDFRPVAESPVMLPPRRRDAAVDFLPLGAVADRIQVRFFRPPSQ